MSKHNHFAKDLDAAFKAARQEYVEAWDKLQVAKDAKRMAEGSDMERQRAELKCQEAELSFKEAEARIWPEFNRRRAELRAALEHEVHSGTLASPDAVDPNGLELLKSGILSADDYYSWCISTTITQPCSALWRSTQGRPLTIWRRKTVGRYIN